VDIRSKDSIWIHAGIPAVAGNRRSLVSRHKCSHEHQPISYSHHQVLEHIAEVLSLLKDAETGHAATSLLPTKRSLSRTKQGSATSTRSSKSSGS